MNALKMRLFSNITNQGATDTYLTVVLVLLSLLASYFFIAAFKPSWRFRWGFRGDFSFKRKPRYKATVVKPKMGGVSCFGSGLVISAFPISYTGEVMKLTSAFAIGFSLGITGLLLVMVGQCFIDKAGEGQGWTKKDS